MTRSDIRRPFLRLTAFVLLLAALALPAVADEQHYGEPFGEAVEVRIGELLESPERYVGERIRVAGLVEDVCPMKGCWISILDAQAKEQSRETVRFKVEDDVVVFPVEAKGEEVVAEGILRARELDEEAARRWFAHLAEEKGEAFDPESVQGAQTIYEIEGIGATVGGE